MQMSVAEISYSPVESDKIPIEVFRTSPLYLRQYQDGELAAELSAREGVLYTTGKLVANGSVELRTVDKNANPEDRLTSLKSERLIAHLVRAKSGFSFNLLSNENKLERVEIPGEAEIKMRGHTITGKVFQLDASTMNLTTQEPVTIVGRNRRLESQGGLQSNLSTRSFKLKGPVQGLEIPTRRGHSVSGKQGVSVSSPLHSRDKK
ncbi:MAG: hypothetical protein RJB13_2327 [Pseudomonadota bacterium]